MALLDFGQCCEVTPAQRELFEHFAANAPTSPEEAKDAERLKGWLNGMGVTVTAQQAPDAAAVFCGPKWACQMPLTALQCFGLSKNAVFSWAETAQPGVVSLAPREASCDHLALSQSNVSSESRPRMLRWARKMVCAATFAGAKATG